MIATLTADQRDALQEIVNIAMGRTGARLAELLGAFVQLSVPSVKLYAAAELPPAIEALAASRRFTATRQSFHDEMHGEAITLFDERSNPDLADLMGYQGELHPAEQRELLLDLSNLLVGACLGGVFEQFEKALSFSPPALIAERCAAQSLISSAELPCHRVLLIEVRFALEARAFCCHLLILMPDASLGLLSEAIDRFVAAV